MPWRELYWEEEERNDDDRPRRNHRRQAQFLSPDIFDGRLRSRSTGGQPQPQINIFTDVNQDNMQRADLRPPTSPSPQRGRLSQRFEADSALALAERLAELRLAMSERSRGRSEAGGYWRDHSPYPWDPSEAARRRIIEEHDAELRRAKEAQDKAIQDHERQKAEDERKAREAQQKAIEDHERQVAEQKKMEKAAQEAAVEKWKKAEADKAAAEKAAYDAFLLQQKEEKIQKKKQEAKEKAEYKDKLWHDLAKFGFTENQIDAMIDQKKAEALPAGQSPKNAIAVVTPLRPVVTKVWRGGILDESLDYWALPWENDRTDPKYIIIRHYLSEAEIDAIRDHSQRIRRRKVMLIDNNKDKGEYVFVRRRNRNPSRSPAGRRRSSPVRVGLGALFR